MNGDGNIDVRRETRDVRRENEYENENENENDAASLPRCGATLRERTNAKRSRAYGPKQARGGIAPHCLEAKTSGS